TVEVTNEENQTYSFSLGELTTQSGSTVEGGFSTDVPPGESRTVNGEWRFGAGQLPVKIRVTVQTGNEREEYEVNLGNIPVRST
ncbi:MAG: hypothetical protein SXQ77_08680, partial [Halobacteria archaeon]|nr:hypothetical protein [Halobacteria archaeon]